MFRFIPSLIVLMCFSATASFATEPLAKPTQNAFSIRFENDFFGGTDENYTNGMSLALTQTGKGLLGGVWDLFGEAAGNRFATYELTQLMFTPSDLARSNPDPTDHPYAGLLYLGFTTHLERDNSLHSLKLIAGVAGPAALAEDVQRFAHTVLNSTHAQGWPYQVKNEPVVNLVYEYRHKYALTPRDAAVGIELIPMGGAFLGNYLIQAETDVQCRIGIISRMTSGPRYCAGSAICHFRRMIRRTTHGESMPLQVGAQTWSPETSHSTATALQRAEA